MLLNLSLSSIVLQILTFVYTTQIYIETPMVTMVARGLANRKTWFNTTFYFKMLLPSQEFCGYFYFLIISNF